MTEERVKRKPSAILSADVVVYSRLMGEDKVSTMRTLENFQCFFEKIGLQEFR
ncbi:MAG: hypothetical protein JW896_14005 [Deltaproteobacteria bacterium]|nr:hypothetical protein [Deltaproteobacteria bacterium]